MSQPPVFKTFSALLREDEGNFLMMAALTVPVVFMAGSLAIDTANALSMKVRLQNAADGAALATASQLVDGLISEADAATYAAQFFNGQIADDINAYEGFSATPTVTLSKSGTGNTTVWQVSVAVVGSQKTTGLARLMGKDSIDVFTSGTSQSARDASNPMSMMLVLDRSGSMGWASGRTTTKTVTKYCGWGWYKYECGTETIQVDIPKIDVLKEAVGDLTNYIADADPTDTYARLGAVSYNLETTSTDKRAITWTKSQVTDFANALVATGGTNSEGAMKWGYEQLVSTTEVNAHVSKNGSSKPSKFIVFMTDGENNVGSDSQNDYVDKQTLYYCDKAKEQDVTIFSVAFQAPQRGKDLLRACSSGDTFYYDANSAEDLVKAFQNIGEEAVKLVTRLVD